MKTIKNIYLLLILIVQCSSCSNSDDDSDKILSAEKEILGFQFLAEDNPAMTQDFTAEIDEEDRSIFTLLQYSYGLSLEELTPHIEISDEAAISPTGEQDFSEAVTYTVTAEDGSIVTYTALVTITMTFRDVLLMIHAENPDNTLTWDLEGEIDTWEGVSMNTDGFITSLNLEDKNLITIPESIEILAPYLEFLYLANNNLSTIPQSVCDMETNGTTITLDPGVTCE